MDGADVDDPVNRIFLTNSEVARKMAHTAIPNQVKADQYAAILFVGGHYSFLCVDMAVRGLNELLFRVFHRHAQLHGFGQLLENILIGVQGLCKCDHHRIALFAALFQVLTDNGFAHAGVANDH